MIIALSELQYDLTDPDENSKRSDLCNFWNCTQQEKFVTYSRMFFYMKGATTVKGLEWPKRLISPTYPKGQLINPDWRSTASVALVCKCDGIANNGLELK